VTEMRSLPRHAVALIAATVMAGAAAAGWLLAARPGGSQMATRSWAVVGLVGAIEFYNWIRPMILPRSGERQAFQVDEAFFVLLALSVPAAATLGTLLVAVTLSQLFLRRPWVKSVFNLGQVALAVSAALAVSRAVAVPGASPSLQAVAGAVAGAAVYFLVSHSIVSAVLLAMGAHWRDCVGEDLRTQLTLAASAVIFAVVVALAVAETWWAAMLAVPLVLAMRLLLVAQFKVQQDRARIRGLFEVTLAANSKLRREAVLDTVGEAVREQLRCETATVRDEPPAAGEIGAEIDEGGSSRRWLVASGRRRQEPFDRADRMVLDAIGAIAQGALANAELYRQVHMERGRLASITLNIGEGVCAVDAAGNLTFVNPAAAALVRLPARQIAVGDDLPQEAMRAPEFLLGPAREAMAAAGMVRSDDSCFEGPAGQPVDVAYTASAIQHNGEVAGAVISFRDITERKRLEATMARQALYDSLTGLANRRLLVDRLESALERSIRDGKRHALIFVDVDRFKAINDSLGHGTGDDLLAAVGSRMRQVAGAKSLVARFGGDEFVILLEDVSGVEEAVTAARRICAAVEMPLVLADGYEIVASVSAGIALAEPGQTADDLLHDADVAMYRAKGRGGTWQVFDRAVMGSRSSDRIDLEAALRKGIERGELEVYYQPIVSVADERIVGAEALVRWRHPTEGLIQPDRFVPMAEETGLILPMGAFVLNEVCRRIRSIRSGLGVDLPISVNLSPRQFQQSSLLSEVAAALDRAGLPSNALKFEITETMVMDDLAGATEIMKKLNRLGVRLAIDDFGTGHSSLGYLKNFPVHEVKVDRTFVNNLASDKVDAAIVGAVVDLADAMGIQAVAEGVETVEQMSALRQLGCHNAQGYLFSRPVPWEDFEALVSLQLLPEVETIELRAV
jgi:diguanylate cyclase (GGDEF)-like protein/PAS domain S-box-containing protein